MTCKAQNFPEVFSMLGKQMLRILMYEVMGDLKFLCGVGWYAKVG